MCCWWHEEWNHQRGCEFYILCLETPPSSHMPANPPYSSSRPISFYIHYSNHSIFLWWVSANARTQKKVVRTLDLSQHVRSTINNSLGPFLIGICNGMQFFWTESLIVSYVLALISARVKMNFRIPDQCHSIAINEKNKNQQYIYIRIYSCF